MYYWYVTSFALQFLNLSNAAVLQVIYFNKRGTLDLSDRSNNNLNNNNNSNNTYIKKGIYA